MPLPDEPSAVEKEPVGRKPAPASPGELRRLGDYEIGLLTTWAPIPVTRQYDDWAQKAAVRLCDDDFERGFLARQLSAAHYDLTRPKEHIGVAVWAPNRAVGQFFGTLTIDWLLPDGEDRLDRPHYLDYLKRTARPKVTVLAQEITSVELPAGPAVRVQERISRPGPLWSGRKIVQENVTFIVFPLGSSDAVKLAFSTETLELAGLLAGDADAIAATLKLTLGDPGSANEPRTARSWRSLWLGPRSNPSDAAAPKGSFGTEPQGEDAGPPPAPGKSQGGAEPTEAADAMAKNPQHLLGWPAPPPAGRALRLCHWGAMFGFPGIPAWLLTVFFMGVAWRITAAAQAGVPDWSSAIWIWLAIGYAQQFIGITCGVLLPRLLVGRAGGRHVALSGGWLTAYSWPLGIVGVVVLASQTDSEPHSLTVWACIVTVYCFVVTISQYLALRQLADEAALPAPSQRTHSDAEL